jgi:heme-degrading monooxygenase HmoA
VEELAVIQVIFRHKVADGTEAAFVTSWEQLKRNMLSRPRGPVEAAILRNASDPTEIVTITLWESVDDWKNYWSEGVPEPEGEPQKNEILEEIKSLSRPRAAPRHRKKPR